ncbi:hypothetical protein Franean1_1432 [Parafrankia sp. EAN1pec]|nr:hypothetical protein Franean1_1432 [Frankia sp. EAN1pec]
MPGGDLPRWPGTVLPPRATGFPEPAEFVSTVVESPDGKRSDDALRSGVARGFVVGESACEFTVQHPPGAPEQSMTTRVHARFMARDC